MNFEQAYEYIDNLNKFGSVLGLDNIKTLMRKLGNPQDKLNVIHVAGTNGKGSTIAFLSHIIEAAGYKVGKYTSPSVFEYLEKYQINNKNISENDYVRIVGRVKKASDEMVLDGFLQPTVFEIETAIAYEYFKDAKCDVAIIETGMGGDTDATNVCDKVLTSVITSISLDHTAILGDTLEEITKHKAGIIKKDCPVVVCNQSNVVVEVIKEYANKNNSPMVISDSVRASEGACFYTTANKTEYNDIKIGLQGEWQFDNAAVAIEAIEILKEKGYNISKEAVKEGLSSTVWPGRFEKINEEPYIIIDGAHNPDAARQLVNTLDKHFADTDFVYIMGVLADKDFSKVVQLTAEKAVKIITVTPNNQRGCSAEKLKETVKLYNENVVAANNIEEALDIAIKKYDAIEGKRAILAFGSLSYLGDFKRICKERYR